jgi:CRISPR/Cas system-associated exonuclease Cas4 (RecB family)
MDRRTEIDTAERAVILRHLQKACLQLRDFYIPPHDNVPLYELRRELKAVLKTLNQTTALNISPPPSKSKTDKCMECNCMYPCSDARSIKPWD